MKPGLEVIHLGYRGKGQVVGIDDGGLAEVLWQRGGKREFLPASELIWRGLAIHTRDGRPGTIVELSRRTGNIRVRLMTGVCCWMRADEVAPREPRQQDVAVELNI